MPNFPLFGQPNNILRRLQIVDISNKAKESLNEVINCEVTQATFTGFKNVHNINSVSLILKRVILKLGNFIFLDKRSNLKFLKNLNNYPVPAIQLVIFIYVVKCSFLKFL